MFSLKEFKHLYDEKENNDDNTERLFLERALYILPTIPTPFFFKNYHTWDWQDRRDYAEFNVHGKFKDNLNRWVFLFGSIMITQRYVGIPILDVVHINLRYLLIRKWHKKCLSLLSN